METATGTTFDSTWDRVRSRSKRIIVATAVVVGLAVPIVGIAPAPAGASAFGCAGFQKIPVQVKGYTGNVYASNYCVGLNGSGLSVRNVNGSFSVNGAPICNYQDTAEFFDSQGRWYQTFTGPLQARCTWGTYAFPSITINKTMKTGKMCSTLKSNGARVTSVCHSIHP